MGQAAVNFVMSINPVGLIVGGIIALVGAVIYCWNTFAGFRGVILGVWEGLKGLVMLIGHLVIDSLMAMANGISGIVKTIRHMLAGEWSQAWETGKTAVSDLTGFTALKNAANNAVKIGSAVKEGFEKGAGAPKIKLGNPLGIPKVPEGFTGAGNTAGNVKTGGQRALSGLNSAKDKAEGITGGGNKNIIINLQKLFDNINISTTQLREGVNDVEQMVTEALLRVLNSANAINI
jgi:hypothetical protein